MSCYDNIHEIRRISSCKQWYAGIPIPTLHNERLRKLNAQAGDEGTGPFLLLSIFRKLQKPNETKYETKKKKMGSSL